MGQCSLWSLPRRPQPSPRRSFSHGSTSPVTASHYLSSRVSLSLLSVFANPVFPSPPRISAHGLLLLPRRKPSPSSSLSSTYLLPFPFLTRGVPFSLCLLLRLPITSTFSLPPPPPPSSPFSKSPYASPTSFPSGSFSLPLRSFSVQTSRYDLIPPFSIPAPSKRHAQSRVHAPPCLLRSPLCKLDATVMQREAEKEKKK